MGKAPLDYISAALQTKSDQFHGELVQATHVKNVIQGCVSFLIELDKIKKALFYGKELEIYQEPVVTAEHNGERMFASLGGTREQDIDMVHAIIGKATEAGELLEALLLGIEGQALDRTNLIEELGDGQWYDAILANALGVSFEKVQQINIDKLRERFPDKFTEYDAQNRDLGKERKVLEQSGVPAQPADEPWKASESQVPKAPAPKAKK